MADLTPEVTRSRRPGGPRDRADRADARRTSPGWDASTSLADVQVSRLRRFWPGSSPSPGIDIDVTAQKRNEAELAELLRRVEMARDAAMEAGLRRRVASWRT